MDVFEDLFTRRSIRKYTDEPVSDADVQTMLKAAMLAPSAKNERPWAFVVVRDAALRAELSEATPYVKMAAHAPVVIVVCGDLNEDKAGGRWEQDCSAAIENLLLAARGLEIGTVWCALHPDSGRVATVRGILGIPEHVVPLGLVCVGHPAQPFSEADRFMPERIHYERWQG